VHLGTLTASLLVPFAFAACRSAAPRAPSPLERAVAVGELMAGTYSSHAQSLADPEFRDVRLQMVRIWPDRTDGCWLYIEQAMAANVERPYRQRVYCVRAGVGDSVESQVFELPGNALDMAGAWRDTSRFASLAPESLSPRAGCTVFLRPDGDGWRGATNASDCASKLQGASYATSEVSVTAQALTSWDRGFDANGVQVWGSTKGAYEFLRE
jgi:hypothetical protein